MPRILIKDQAEQKTIILLPPPPPFSPKEIIKSDQLSWTPQITDQQQHQWNYAIHAVVEITILPIKERGVATEK